MQTWVAKPLNEVLFYGSHVPRSQNADVEKIYGRPDLTTEVWSRGTIF